MLLAAMILFANIACMLLVAIHFYVLLLLRLVFVNVFMLAHQGCCYCHISLSVPPALHVTS